MVRALAAHGQVTIKLADLDGRAGLTHFPSNTVHIDHRLSFVEFIGTLGHELTHLVRGPLPPHLAANAEAVEAEEIATRHETADLLIPTAPALRAIPRTWTDAELDVIARDHGVDIPTARDAIWPPPIPTQRRRLTLGVESVA